MSDWLNDADDVLAFEEAAAEKRAGATTWKPHTNDEHPKVLKGTLIEGEIANTEYGDTGVLTIEDESGDVWTVWCGAKLLKDALSSNAPKIGSGIIIKEDGMRQPKNPGGREFRMYTMVAQAQDFEHWTDSWKQLAAKKAEAVSEYTDGVSSDEMEAPY